MNKQFLRLTFFLMCFSLPLTATAQVISIPDPVTPPFAVREVFELDLFYQQWIDVGGLPVVASAEVSPYALTEAAWLIRQMIGHRPDVLQALVPSKIRFTVIGYTELLTDIPEYSDHQPDFLTYRIRGLGGSGLSGYPAASASEENLLHYPGINSSYNILFHEFAHVIHRFGLKVVDPTFDGRVEIAYKAAMEKGLWQGTYAAADRKEYWAEGTQGWLNPKGGGSFSNYGNTRQALKAYDPGLAALLTEIYGDGDWRYTPPTARTHLPHLQGFSPQDSPTFQGWTELEALYRQFQDPNSDGGDNWVDLRPYDPSLISSLDESRTVGDRTMTAFVNLTQASVLVYRVRRDGTAGFWTRVRPGRVRWHPSYPNDSWLIKDSNGKNLAVFQSVKKTGRALITSTLHLIKPGLSKVSGDNQNGISGTVLSNPFVIEVRDQNLSGLEGISVTFSVTAGDGTLSITHTMTDENGQAESTFTFGPSLGTNTVGVSAAGIEQAVTFNAVAEAAVDIPDPNLRAAVETALGKVDGDLITPAEMSTLTELNARDAFISDLTGLGFATNLITLRLHNNHITDISPLSSLTDLEGLYLDNSNIADISALSGLINLRALGLGGNRISDISTLSRLTRLTRLRLGRNNITDLSPLVANTGFGSGDELEVQGTPLSYISITTHIPALQQRGVTVTFDDMTHLNVGQPRTVQMIYFLPNDRPYQAEVVQGMKEEIRTVQTFFADQMETHGYGRRTFRVETDSQGEPMVHRVDGQHPDNHYVSKDLANFRDSVESKVLDEITQMFNIRTNIYVIFLDTGIGKGRGGAGQRLGNGGEALIFPPINERSTWQTVAHELGHAFGLLHDFRDGSFLMSYGPASRDQLAVCHADFLSVHPYFNPDTSIKDLSTPTIKLISPRTYPADAKSIPIQLQVSDSEGLHQAILYTAPYNGPTILTNDSSVTACFELGGKKETVIDFDYDGIVPFAHNPSYSRSNSFVHPIHVDVVDTSGNMTPIDFLLFSEALESLMKISGDNQTGLPNTPLPVPFVVEVWDVNSGRPRREISVVFTVIAGGGTLSVAHTTTDDKGRAESILTLGANLEANIVSVSAAGIEQTVTFTAVAGAAVDIPDPNLRAAIEEARGKAPGTPIALSEMAALTRIEARDANISDLTGLQAATNLTSLALGYGETGNGNSNAVTDLSPLADLIQLTSLDLAGNSISDISAVADLTNLTWLHLWGNSISDISPVVGLTNLTTLYLGDNNISNLSPLVANTGLEEGDLVNVQYNPLSYQSIHVHIPALQSRGVDVQFDAGGTRPPDVNKDGNVNVLDLIFIRNE